MKTLDMAKAKAPLMDYAREVVKEPVILTVKGKPVAALVSIENADMETATLSTHPQFLDIIARSRSNLKSQGGISSDEIRHRLGISS
jgi:prevent-host-death family protein